MNEERKPEAAEQTDKEAPVSEPAKQKKNRKFLWPVLFVVFAAGSIWAVTSQVKNFSLQSFAEYLSRADRRWLAAAVLAMLGFIVFEGMALKSICDALGYKTRLRSGCMYAAADIYFSAITPSATGGQPAAALLMMRDGVPGIVTTAILLYNLAMYSLAILAIGLLSLIFMPEIYFRFGTFSRVLIILGYAAQLALSLLLLMLIKSERLLEKLGYGAINLLSRLHLMRNPEKKREKLSRSMVEYRKCAEILSGQRKLLIRPFIFNFLQRASQILVTVFAYLAMGGRLRLAGDIFTMQSYVVIGSNCVPIPGAIGVADYLMLDGFGSFLPDPQAVEMELLSRSLSFYCCIIICAAAVLFSYSRAKRRELHK
jgi:hypothetical protein